MERTAMWILNLDKKKNHYNYSSLLPDKTFTSKNAINLTYVTQVKNHQKTKIIPNRPKDYILRMRSLNNTIQNRKGDLSWPNYARHRPRLSGPFEHNNYQWHVQCGLTGRNKGTGFLSFLLITWDISSFVSWCFILYKSWIICRSTSTVRKNGDESR